MNSFHFERNSFQLNLFTFIENSIKDSANSSKINFSDDNFLFNIKYYPFPFMCIAWNESDGECPYTLHNG